MSDFSIYRYMKLGIVHFKAFPEVILGNGPIIETLRKIAEDEFWTAIEVGWIKDPRIRDQARKLLEAAHMEVCYACQPMLFSQKLNINHFDRGERKKALNAMKNGISQAYHLGASSARVFSGKDPGPGKREEAKKILIDSLMEICRFNKELGDMKLFMKVFDRDIDKQFLVGPFAVAAEVAEAVSKEFPDFGVLADLSHFPLLDEKPAEAIPLVDKFPMHFHIGNCVKFDRAHPLYGDLQPRFGIEGGELDTDDVRDYFRLLKERDLIGPDKMPVLSVEVRPLMAEEYSEIIIANAKRVIMKAWATL
jgi:sugar phosphate isomerase/epimerase